MQRLFYSGCHSAHDGLPANSAPSSLEALWKVSSLTPNHSIWGSTLPSARKQPVPLTSFAASASLCFPHALPLLQMEGSQARHAHPPKAWSFLKLWSCGIWPLSSGTQFKGVSLSEESHLSSAARNNHRERYLKAVLSPHPRHVRELPLRYSQGGGDVHVEGLCGVRIGLTWTKTHPNTCSLNCK